MDVWEWWSVGVWEVAENEGRGQKSEIRGQEDEAEWPIEETLNIQHSTFNT